jgi:aryl-alcohol dehydrogenase-like predicted oxidoreductase
MRLLELMPMAKELGIGIINASPFASGLLTESGAASWHPARKQERALFQAAATLCQKQGTSIEKVALQFASQRAEIPTTMFSTSSRDRVKQNVQWFEEEADGGLVKQIQQILMPISNKEWKY